MRCRSIVVVLAVIATTATAAMPEEIDLPRDTSHAERDCEKAIKRGDYRFIGVFGFTFIVPQINDGYQWRKTMKPLGFKAVRGTSDVHRPGDFFNERARAYATAYNRVLVTWVEAHHPTWLGPIHKTGE